MARIDRKAADYMSKIGSAINDVTNADGSGFYVVEVRVAFDGEDMYRLVANDFEDYDITDVIP